MMPHVFNIPASANFLVELARAILRGGFPAPDTPAPGPEDLARWTILVPTRRAARALQQIFLDNAGRKAVLLPRIRPIGDIDEDILDIYEPVAAADEAAIDPAISSLAREFLLVRLIEEWAGSTPSERLAQEIAASPIQALNLARSLAKLIDDFESRNLEFDLASTVYDIEIAQHREAIIGFLQIVTRTYPQWLHREGFIGAVKRRSLLITREAERLQANPPGHPFIAAGSTGSVAATAQLLNVIARLDQGTVVLPGLDRFMDEQSWETLGEESNAQGPAHPQYGMRQLLKSMGLLPAHVELLPGLVRRAEAEDRDWLASEVMRPAATADRWYRTIATNRHRIGNGLTGVEPMEAANPREEAAQIALRIRGELELPDRTVALVTPDRELALRVKGELSRWAIAADDSAGTSLTRTLEGSLFYLFLDLAGRPQNPVSWASLIHHPLTNFGGEAESARWAAAHFDLVFLRHGQWQGNLAQLVSGFDHIKDRTEGDRFAHPSIRRMTEDDWAALRRYAANLAHILTPLVRQTADNAATNLDIVTTFIVDVFEQCVSPADPWKSAAGESLSSCLIAILQEGHYFPETTFRRACLTLSDLIARPRVRTPMLGGARFAILGLLEARLIRADLMIVAGLNETVWPEQPDTGPWLNRPMRHKLGLESPEREIGLVAHDFIQAFGSPNVVLSWSKRRGDAPATPSRWLLRLDMLRKAAGMEDIKLNSWHAWSRELDQVDVSKPVKRPAPRPKARLAGISISQVEKLYRDPYAIYAAHLLDLKPLEGFASRAEASERGTLVHDALAQFIAAYPGALPADAEARLIEMGRGVFGERLVDPDIRAFWWPRFRRIAKWFIAEETILRVDALTIITERSGQLALSVAGEAFRLSGRADRIDVLHNRRVRVIDYKTGVVPSPKQVEEGYSPQLTLEAAMIARSGFRDIPAYPASELLYIKLSGGEPAGELKPVAVNMASALADRHLETLVAKLENLASGIEAYMPLRMPFSDNDVSDYDHLSRRAEWERS